MSYGYGTKSAYIEADVLSRSKEWLIPLLYEHLVASLRRAAVQIELKDVEGRAQSLDKASGIVLELASSLDREKGGALAGQMASLYAFFISEILHVGRTQDPARLQRIIDMAQELSEAWTQAAEQVSPRGSGWNRAASAA